jgi:signal transduction histidine kinase
VAVTRSWTEVIDTLHDGLAIIDADHRFTFVSDQFEHSVGVATTALMGRELPEALPGLVGVEGLDELGPDHPIRFEYRSVGPDRGQRWARLTLVDPCLDDGSVVVLSQNATETQAALEARRAAQLRLTEVAAMERSRICDELHDGPIQLLAALALRLDVAQQGATPRGTLQALRTEVDAVVGDLRDILADLSDVEGSMGSTCSRSGSHPSSTTGY